MESDRRSFNRRRSSSTHKSHKTRRSRPSGPRPSGSHKARMSSTRRRTAKHLSHSMRSDSTGYRRPTTRSPGNRRPNSTRKRRRFDLDAYAMGWLRDMNKLYEHHEGTGELHSDFVRRYIFPPEHENHDPNQDIASAWSERMRRASTNYEWQDQELRREFVDNLRGQAQTGDFHLGGIMHHATGVAEHISSGKSRKRRISRS